MTLLDESKVATKATTTLQTSASEILASLFAITINVLILIKRVKTIITELLNTKIHKMRVMWQRVKNTLVASLTIAVLQVYCLVKISFIN